MENQLSPEYTDGIVDIEYLRDMVRLTFGVWENAPNGKLNHKATRTIVMQLWDVVALRDVLIDFTAKLSRDGIIKR